jgi:exodeoxyribonuclease V gamma subunit
VLRVSSATQPGPLAAALAEVLSEPLLDPLAPEWVAVPTAGIQRWLALELSRSLGAAHLLAGDGIAANIQFVLPGALRQAVLDAGRPAGSADPWHVERLVWAILDVLHNAPDDRRLSPLTVLPPGATWYGRARRLADLFDRYAVRRPDLLVRWHHGQDVDTLGNPLPTHDRWQPHLWRLTRARIGEPSPAERLPDLLAALHKGSLALNLPPRLALFGLTTMPGGSPFLELLRAIGVQRDLHLFLLDLSPAATRALRSSIVGGAPALPGLRAEDLSHDVVRHPLLRSWGRPARERTVLLATAEREGIYEARSIDPPDTSAPHDRSAPLTLLAKIQQDLRADRSPEGNFVPDPADRSIQVHSCHGPVRQVEVLRDAILHLLAMDPTLREEDIAILCPAISTFAPLVEASFGTSAERPGSPPDNAPPRLLYRLADRSLHESYPVLAALDALLELLAGRSGASAVFAFLSMEPVRRRFRFDEEDLATIADWIAETNVRWGYDGTHRDSWGLPATFASNSWQAGIDRLLVGVAVSDDDLSLAPGAIAPLRVEGDQIEVAGRFADLIARLHRAALDVTHPRPAAQWCDTLANRSDEFFEVDSAQQWQFDHLRRIMADIATQAQVGDTPATVSLTFADLRRLLAEHLKGAPPRPDFFRGGITVTSLAPLRGLPFRVLCLLGFDETGLAVDSTEGDGDDLAAHAPQVGDRDPRAESRQAILEAVLAAGDHLVVTRTGRDLRTNREVPRAVAFAELRDTLRATLAPEHRDTHMQRIETVHPRQAFDERCFSPGVLFESRPWSFDPGAHAGAVARRQRHAANPALLSEPLPPKEEGNEVISLADLRSFLNHPVKMFLRQRLGLHLLDEDLSASDDLVTSLEGLANWSVAQRLLEARLAGHTTHEWERHERALGSLPPGDLARRDLQKIIGGVDALLASAESIGVRFDDPKMVPVEITLLDGTRIVGLVEDRCPESAPGPATITFSHPKPSQHLAAWIDLIALQATDPDRPWQSVAIRQGKTSKPPDILQLVGNGSTPDEKRTVAIDALGVAVDCFLRAQREPLPLFPTLSHRLHQGKAGNADWLPYQGHGDGHDTAHQLAFANASFTHIRGLRARDDDPPGSSPWRAERYANYLWGAVEESSRKAP